MDLINTGSDPWILEHDSCERVAREIMEHVNARDSEMISSQAYNALHGKIRIKLKQFSTEVSELSRKLNLAGVINSITPEERERRRRQVESLQSREHKLRDLFDQRKVPDDSNSAYDKTRAQLFQGKGRSTVFAGKETTSWGESRNSDNEDYSSRNVSDMEKEQERLLQEQNQGLESLMKIVTGQKRIATLINNEVEHHNEMLVEIADGMERVDNKISGATDMVSVIGKKENIWGYWLIAFLLFIAILGVAFA